MYQLGLIGSLAVYMLLVGATNSRAEEFRSVSVFSPIDARGFFSSLQAIAKTNRPLSDRLNATIDFDKALNSRPVLPIDEPAIASIVKKPDDVVRRNLLVQNVDQLDALIISARADQNIVPLLSLDLFEDVHLKVVVRSIKRLDDGTLSIAGVVQDMPGSMVTLAKKGSVLTGTIRTYSEIYQIYPSATGQSSFFGVEKTLLNRVLPQIGKTTIIDQISPKFEKDIEPKLAPAPSKKSSSGPGLNLAIGDDPAKPDTKPVIDVAVFYTAAAQIAANATVGIKSVVIQSMQSVQSALDEYKIRATVNLIYSDPINYQESGDIFLDLDRLHNPANGYLADVPVLRDRLKADVVVLIVERAQLCGYSFIPGDPQANYSEFAYMVIRRNCSITYLSFAHEFGHLLGARHDRYADSAEGKPVPSNHGSIIKCGDKYCSDMMATQNYCVDVLRVSECQRLPVWSGVTWTGVSVPESPEDVNNNTQRALRLYAPIVARYR
jgi:hypothetical protein